MKKVAIAYQGGGSHTAFTAGILQNIPQAKMDDADFDIVALTGTSLGVLRQEGQTLGAAFMGQSGEK